jgi:hypothetical protein
MMKMRNIKDNISLGVYIGRINRGGIGMRKGVSKLLTAAFVIASLTACGNEGSLKDLASTTEAQTEEVTEAATETETEAATEASTEAVTEAVTETSTEEYQGDPDAGIDFDYYWKVYSPVLNQFYADITEGFQIEDAYYSTGLSEAVKYDDDPLNNIGFICTDSNGDNIPELYVGMNESYDDIENSKIFNGYTYEDGKITEFLTGWNRNSYSWMNNGHYFYSGSAGAAASAFGECQLNEEGTWLEWNDFYFINPKSDGNIGFYHNKTGEWDIEQAEEMNISDDEFFKIKEGYKTGPLSWIPFASWPEIRDSVSGAYSDTNGKSVVSVTYEEEMTSKPSQYLENEPAEIYDYTTYVYFTAETEVKNFRIVDLHVFNVDDDGNVEYLYDERYKLDALTPDTPVRAGLNFIGDIPNNGFMYTDDTGVDHLFVIGQSGMDGSLVIQEYK